MGLDASVYCNCYEMGQTTEPPIAREFIFRESDGSLNHRSVQKHDAVFDDWVDLKACKHKFGKAQHYYFGNIYKISSLRNFFETQPSQFSILLTKVVMSGMHSGDILQIELLPDLEKEINYLIEVTLSGTPLPEGASDFAKQMLLLVQTARKLGHPISF